MEKKTDSIKIIQANADGYLEEVDMFTGEVRAIEEDLSTAIMKAPLENNKIVRDIDGKMVYVPSNATVEQLKQVQAATTLCPIRNW